MVVEAERRGDLVLTGLYFDVGEAQVSLSDPVTGAFVTAGTPTVARHGG
jgi:carbonic anhydrase